VLPPIAGRAPPRNRHMQVATSVGLGSISRLKRIQAQLRTGKGILKVARERGVGSGTVQRIKQEMDGPFVGVAA